jgi:hypothetical protein
LRWQHLTLQRNRLSNRPNSTSSFGANDTPCRSFSDDMPRVAKHAELSQGSLKTTL